MYVLVCMYVCMYVCIYLLSPYLFIYLFIYFYFLFYFILFYFILFYFILLYSVLIFLILRNTNRTVIDEKIVVSSADLWDPSAYPVCYTLFSDFPWSLIRLGSVFTWKHNLGTGHIRRVHPVTSWWPTIKTEIECVLTVCFESPFTWCFTEEDDIHPDKLQVPPSHFKIIPSKVHGPIPLNNGIEWMNKCHFKRDTRLCKIDNQTGSNDATWVWINPTILAIRWSPILQGNNVLKSTFISM